MWPVAWRTDKWMRTCGQDGQWDGWERDGRKVKGGGLKRQGEPGVDEGKERKGRGGKMDCLMDAGL